MKLWSLILGLGLILCLGSCEKEGCTAVYRADCYCPMVYDPVCGCDGQIYGNSCEAECNGITQYTAGACQ